MTEKPDPEIRGDLDPSQLVFRQMDRINRMMSEDGPEESLNGINALMDNLPPNKLAQVLEREDDYTDKGEEWVYRTFAGKNIGTPENPINGSPYLAPYERINPRKLKHVLNVCWQDMGVWWKTEPTNSEYGLYPEEEIKSDPPTPVFEEDLKKNENQEQKQFHQTCWIKFEDKFYKITNFRGYAVGIGPGEKPWFFNEIALRQAKQEPIVILITGVQGKGKSYLGLRIAEIFDKKFNPELQIAIERSEITKLISGRSRLKENQVIIIDESQFGAGARSWTDKGQQDLMNFLAAARFYRYIIIIVALHRSMLDSIIRNRILNYHIHMEDRGLATVYEPSHQRFDEFRYPSRRGKLVLQLPDYDRCSSVTCLTCKYKSAQTGECNSIRAIYERKKERVVKQKAEEKEQEQIAKETKKLSDMDFIPVLINYREELTLTQKGYVEPASIQRILLRELGADIGVRRAENLRKRLVLHDPTILQTFKHT